MDADLVIGSLAKHLDALSSLLSWVIGLALITAWAGLQRHAEVSILSMKVARKDAFYLLGAAFLYVNIAAILYFARISDLLLLVKTENLHRALTVVGTHAWPFNPYAYFGQSTTSLLLSNFGYGALITIWWIGYSALALVQDDKRAPGYFVVIGAFFVVGLISMGAIQNGFLVILSRSWELNRELEDSIRAQVFPRSVFTMVGIGFGAFLFWLTQRLQNARILEDEGSNSPGLS